MTFWAHLETVEAGHRDKWLDVEPALCATCREVKRGVLLGICAECFAAWESSR